jgi:hypothetical protein
MNLKIKTAGFFCNTWPVMTIIQGENKYEYQIEEESDVNLVLDNAPFQIGMFNKSFGKNRIWDTKTDSSGNILEDKFIEIKEIEIDEVSVLHLLTKIDYNSKEQGCCIVHDRCLRFNGHWNFDIGENPYDWIIDKNYQKTNQYRDTSYFSDFSVVTDYREHYYYIKKIKDIMSQ